jgi:hypothetical protein
MTGFRFIFPDDDEGFELLEENEAISADDEDDDQEEPTQINNENDVIWETEED